MVSHLQRRGITTCWKSGVIPPASDLRLFVSTRGSKSNPTDHGSRFAIGRVRMVNRGGCRILILNWHDRRRHVRRETRRDHRSTRHPPHPPPKRNANPPKKSASAARSAKGSNARRQRSQDWGQTYRIPAIAYRQWLRMWRSLAMGIPASSRFAIARTTSRSFKSRVGSLSKRTTSIPGC